MFGLSKCWIVIGWLIFAASIAVILVSPEGVRAAPVALLRIVYLPRVVFWTWVTKDIVIKILLLALDGVIACAIADVWKLSDVVTS